MPQNLPTVRAVKGAIAAARADLLLYPVTDGDLAAAWRRLGKALGGALARRAKAAEFTGKDGDVLVHQTDKGAIVALGVGKTLADAACLRKAGARGRREAERQRARRVGAYLGAAAVDATALGAFAEGFQLAGYRFERYKHEPKPAAVGALTIVGEQLPAASELKATLARVETVSTEVYGARDLVNEPASVATPRFIAAYAERLAQEVPGLEVETWAPKRMEKEGLAGTLAVARGTAEEPRFLRLHWAGPGAKKRVAIVGKGITFDSGGLSLKPAKSMETMKYDMAGGAATIAAVAAAARLRLPVDVTGYVPLTENLPGGRAQKPGDVIRFVNGKTAEVLNTDAEGRLVLADGLAIAGKAKPDALIDLATLTGAARVALGAAYAAVLGTNQALVDALVAAGTAAGEPIWQLPLAAEYREDIKSPIADVKNVGSGGEAGTIIGALFLQEFVPNGVSWAHLDIAGPAYAERDLPHAPKGATGFGVRLLVEYLRRLAA